FLEDFMFWSYYGFADKLPVMAGFYNDTVKIESVDKPLFSLTESSILFKVCNDVIVDDLKVGVLQKDEAINGTLLLSLTKFSNLGKVFSADYTKHLYPSFSVKRKSDGSLIEPSQYLFNGYKDFGSPSGKYTASQIVGDPLIRIPLKWPFVSD
ncbi:hypothetical protein KIN20_000993, partial [Parelaphostrongylus tenuis]